MKIISSIAFVSIGFAGMEIFSWFFHKYIMHGPLWYIHKTHHVHTKSLFEWNDIFSFVFGMVAAALIISGAGDLDFRFWMGMGITQYGFIYFALHDVLIHRRLKCIKRLGNRYFISVQRAHLIHHKSNKKEAESYGLLWIPRKYLKG